MKIFKSTGKRVNNLFKSENMFVYVILLVFLFLSLFLIVELNTTRDVLHEKQIGSVTEKRNMVKRRGFAHFTWNDIEKNNQVLNKDTLRTGQSSHATVVLNDCTEIEMTERSEVFIELSDKVAQIVVKRGFVDVRRDGIACKPDTPVTIKTAGKKIRLRKGKIKISKEKDEEARLFVDRGEVEITTKDTKKIVVEGERATVSKTEITVKSVPVRLLHPGEYEKYFLSDKNMKIDFSWKEGAGDKGSPEKRNYVHEISRSRNFSSRAIQASVRGNKTSVNLGEGGYFWRVSYRNIKGEIEKSEIQNFLIVKLSPVRLHTPDDGEEMEYFSSLPLIHFSWQSKEHASSYVLELSRESNFTTLLKSVVIRSNRLSIQWRKEYLTTQTGLFYWRIRAKNKFKDVPDEVSPVRRFRMTRKKSIKPPVPISPENDKRIYRLLISRIGIRFNWSQGEEIVKTAIVISKNKNFSLEKHTFYSNSNFFILKQPFDYGRYYWRIRGIDARGKDTAYSDVRSFSITKTEEIDLVYPENNTIFQIYDIEDVGVKFNWKKLGIAGTFTLQIASDDRFRSLVRSQAGPSNIALVRIKKAGKFYWRVSFVSDDTIIKVMSSVRTLEINDVLTDPDPVYPGKESDVDMSHRDILTFSWKSAQGANVYEFQLYQIINRGNRAEKKLLLTHKTRKSKIKVIDLKKLDIGTFLWKLKALRKDSNGRVICSSREVNNKFSINLGDLDEKTASKVKVISPSVQVVPE